MDEAGSAGWAAQLALRFERRTGRTVLAHRSHDGPLAVQKPFYPEEDVCHVYLLHPPGGVVGGDRLAIEIEVASDAHAVITTPAASKFYRSAGPASMQEQLLSVTPGAALEWLPQETILYAGCRASLSTRVTLVPGARFIGWEVLCLGRPAAGERFDAGLCRQHLELWCEDRPLVIERSTIAGASELLRAPWGFGERTASGTFVATPADQTMLAAVREAVAVEGDDLFSATLLDSVLLCRYLGDSAESARCCFRDAWGAVRPGLLGRASKAAADLEDVRGGRWCRVLVVCAATGSVPKSEAMHTSTCKLTKRYQATIPEPVRTLLDLGAGDAIAFDIEGDEVRLRKARPVDLAFAQALQATLEEWSSEADEEAWRGL